MPIIGDPIAQAKAPHGSTRLFAERGCNAVVIPLQCAAGDFTDLFQALTRSGSIGGLIATVPHKFALAQACTSLSERSRVIGAANVARRGPDGWVGDHVDGEGFVTALRAAGGVPEGARALQIGAGGAGSAIGFALLEAGVAQLAIHDIDVARRDELIARLSAVFGDRVVVGSPDPTGFDLVAQTSPLGMRPDDPLPLDVDLLQDMTVVGDAVAKPEVTPLLAAARQRGCQTSTGVQMFDAVAELIADYLQADGPLAASD